MDYQEVINNVRSNYQDLKLFFDKDELYYLTLRDDKKRRFIGLFIRSYWKRKDLFLKGTIFYSYVFKEYQLPNNDALTDSAIWMIISPNKIFDQHPEKYLEIIESLNNFMEKKKVSLKEKKLQRLLKENLSEPTYYVLPFDITQGYLVYLCSTYVINSHNPHFHLGLNLVISAPHISKEIALLPNKYWTTEWKNIYIS